MFSHFSTSHSKAQSSNLGFGLIELLVSISIMVIVITIVLVRQTSFNGAVLLRSQAYEVALQLRTIQLNAVSASAESGGYRSVLGVHFRDGEGENSSYRIFSDSTSGANSNYYWNASEEYGLQGLLDPRFEISDVRTTGGTYNNGGLSVVFERPNFDARFFDSNGEIVGANSVEIDISRVDAAGATGPGDLRTVEVTSAGQISVK